MSIHPDEEREVVAKVKAARDMITALCKPRGSEGAREWSMSIPARPAHDPDLVISAALDEVEDLLFRLRAARARVTEVERQCAARVAHEEASYSAMRAALTRDARVADEVAQALADEGGSVRYGCTRGLPTQRASMGKWADVLVGDARVDE